MLKKVSLILVVTLGLGGALGLAYSAYLKYKSPLNKCFRFKEYQDDLFAKALVFQVLNRAEDHTYGIKLVEFKQPEDLNETMFVLQASTGKIRLKSLEALIQTQCPLENK